MKRRTFLAGSLTVPLLAGFGEATRVNIAELDLGAPSAFRPRAWERVLYEMDASTSVSTSSRIARVRPDEAALFDHPFCVLSVASAFEIPTAVEALNRYLSYGGFLLVDDVSGGEDPAIDLSIRRLAAVLFPARPLAQLPSDHAIYRSFFLVRRAVGRLDRHPLTGVISGDATPFVVSRNDMGGALDRSADGAMAACIPGGETQRQRALQLAVNLVMYTLTSDYKKDQVHVKRLLEEGRIAR